MEKEKSSSSLLAGTDEILKDADVSSDQPSDEEFDGPVGMEYLKMNVQKGIGFGKGKALGIFTRHRMVVLGVMAFLCLAIVGRTLKKNADAAVAAKDLELAQMRNNYTAEMNRSQEKVTKVLPMDHGLSTARWASDEKTIKDWIEPAFTFSNLEEYMRNRQFYVERLGATHPFVRDFLVEKTQEDGYAFNNNYGEMRELTKDVNMRMRSIKTFVTGIDTSGDVYSYLAIITVESTDESGNVGSGGTRIILFCDVTKDGEVRNFSYTLTE